MSGRSFEHRFRETRRIVDDVLTEVPQSLLEARRLVTREWSFDPRAEELQAIVRIAGFMSASVVCYELARQMLALRVLAEREWNEFARSPRLEPQRLARTTETLRGLIEAYERARDDLQPGSAAMATLGEEERGYLRHVCGALALPLERLETATLLAPRLERLGRGAQQGTLEQSHPELLAEERRQISLSVASDAAPGASRVCLEAIALRDALADGAGAEVLPRMRAVFEIVHERLLRQQAEARAAGLDRFVAEIGAAEKRLKETFEKVCGEGAPRPSRATGPARDAGKQEEVTDRPQRERVYRAALRKLGFAPKRGEDPEVARARLRTRRRLALLAVAALLGIAAGAVHVLLPAPPLTPPAVSLREFQPSLDVLDARPIGAMLYVRVADWERLPLDRVRFRAAEIGAVAAEHGYAMVYVVSERGRPLAEWHAGGGVIVARDQTLRGT